MRAPPRPPLRILFAVLFVSLLAGTFADTHAVGVSGRLSVWSYLRDDSVDHAMIVPNLSLNVYQAGHRDVTFQTTLRGFTDIRNGESNLELLRVQRAVFVYAPKDSRFKLHLGQQWIHEGVGFGNLAGARAYFPLCPTGGLTAYAGLRTPRVLYFDSDDGDIEDEGINAGLHFRRGIGKHRVGLSYTYLTKDGDLRYQAGGLDALLRFHSRLLTRARAYYNIEQSALERAQLTAMWDATDRVRVTGEVRNQTPRVFEDSYFARFLEDAGTRQGRFGVQWRFGRGRFLEGVYVKGTALAVASQSDDLLYKTRIALGDKNLEVGYTHWLSVAEGDMDGFYGKAVGSIRVNNRRVGSTFLGFDFARGSNSTVRPNTESQSAYYGIEADVCRSFGLTARGEHVRDHAHSTDWRGLFSITWRFSTLAGGVR